MPSRRRKRSQMLQGKYTLFPAQNPNLYKRTYATHYSRSQGQQANCLRVDSEHAQCRSSKLKKAN